MVVTGGREASAKSVPGRWAVLVAALLIVGSLACAPAGAGVTVHQPNAQAGSLLEAWLAMPRLESVNPAFTFVSTSQSTYIRKHQRGSILAEFRVYRNNLDLSESQAQQLSEWARAIKQQNNRLRVPGEWDPATLLAEPSRMPKLTALSAYGYCETVDTIEIWDGAGTRRIAWRAGMDLQALISEQRIRIPVDADWVTLIRPRGERVQVGIRAWNQGTVDLVPGTRVVTPIHFAGADTSWLNSALPEYLSHVMPGRDCTKWLTVDGSG